MTRTYHPEQPELICPDQVAKHPLSTPGPAGVYTPPPSRHATLPGAAQVRPSMGDMASISTQGVLAGITMTGSLPYNFPANMTPNMGARDISSLGLLVQLVPTLPCLMYPDQSSGYPTPRPGTAASDLDTSYYMGRLTITPHSNDPIRTQPPNGQHVPQLPQAALFTEDEAPLSEVRLSHCRGVSSS